jgi:hypothetical protein
MDGLTLLVGSIVAVAVVVEVVRAVQRRRAIRIRRVGESEFVVTFEAASAEEVADIVRALLRELDGPLGSAVLSRGLEFDAIPTSS